MSWLRFLWQIPTALLVLTALLFLINEYSIARPSERTNDIPYLSPNSPEFSAERHVLDVYAPNQKTAQLRPVVIFIHGGNWDSGSKNLYAFIGRRLAKQGVVAVLINYRLSPAVRVPAMADDCARAVLWTTQHIGEYGGDPNRIFVMGHSAGGGLAALVATDRQLLEKWKLPFNAVKGAILDDPAGLDMFDYLKKMEFPGDEQYLVPFSTDSTVWRAMSALYQVTAAGPPILLYTGSRTYPGIIRSTQKFHQRLLELGVKHEYKVFPGKKHVGMVAQLFWKNNLIYQDLLKLVGAPKSD
ncbi:alpha/beta hydrolase [Larkinella terrae]|uniref:Alpha/beta fold hydrolase n=1 Tax=Larkinella terrae TaxID=2025311 RepID=A0A7K0EMR0_9BACT|nr:alpha/beta hydrolase [Larkinella terrae]MRS62831.1 alpha/beta fold hydrolase [Larkinella terrae]